MEQQLTRELIPDIANNNCGPTLHLRGEPNYGMFDTHRDHFWSLLKDALKANTSLRTLVFTKVNTDTVRWFSENYLIDSPTKLTALGLSSLAPDAIEPVAHALQNPNSKLTTLWLDSLSLDVIQKILEAITSSIVILKLITPTFSEQSLQLIYDHFKDQATRPIIAISNHRIPVVWLQRFNELNNQRIRPEQQPDAALTTYAQLQRGYEVLRRENVALRSEIEQLRTKGKRPSPEDGQSADGARDPKIPRNDDRDDVTHVKREDEDPDNASSGHGTSPQQS